MVHNMDRREHRSDNRAQVNISQDKFKRNWLEGNTLGKSEYAITMIAYIRG